MTNDQLLRNIRCMEEMFPAFIEHYKRAATHGNMDTWARAIHSVIDLVTNEDETPAAKEKS